LQAEAPTLGGDEVPFSGIELVELVERAGEARSTIFRIQDGGSSNI
jgi:hypothetical protein